MDIESESEGLRGRALALGELAFNAVTEADVAALRDRAFPELAADVLPPGTLNAGIVSGVLAFCRLALACKVMAETTGTPPAKLWGFIRLTALDGYLAGHLDTEADREAWRLFEARLCVAAFLGGETDGR